MPSPFKATGGARVGWTNATYPLARLSATTDQLSISIHLLGTYTFAPDQVATVEKYVMIPVIASGVRIRHCNADCPDRFIFWCRGNPDKVLDGIRDSGFVPTAPISAIPIRRGPAMRWSTIIIAIAVWNGLGFLSFSRPGVFPPRPDAFVLTPLLFAFTFSIGTLTSPWLQSIVLKPDRRVGEIKPLLRLLAFISGLLLVIFSILLATGAFRS